jgi:magnesium transporter
MAAREEHVTTATDLAIDQLPHSLYRDGDTIRRDLHPREIAEIVRSGTGALWVDIDSTNRHHHAMLEKVFNFHPLAIEDTLNPSTRVKLEEYDGYLFIVVRAVDLEASTPDPYDLQTTDVYFFLGSNYLVTVHAGRCEVIETAVERMLRAPDALARGVERIMYAIMDSAVDAYFPLLDRIDEFIDTLEERVFVQFDQTALRDIFAVKRMVLSLKRYLAPQREVFNVLTNRPSALLSTESQVYFRDIYDHVLRINDSLDTYRELLSSTLDSYLSQVSNRLGQVTKALSVVATLSLPFVVVSGMWGMNVSHIPLATNPHGFMIMLAAQLAIGLLLLLLLRRAKIL